MSLTLDRPEPVTRELDLDRIIKSWAKGQVLYDAPLYEDTSSPRYWAERIAIERPDLEDAVKRLLDHPNQLVAAYALMTLELLGTDLSTCVTADVMKRTGQITISLGSFHIPLALGVHAKRVLERSNNRRLRAK